MNVPFRQMMATGGGGRSPMWRQMMADVFDCPIVTSGNKEGPALGVAILAGVGAGIYSGIPAACKKIISENEPQLPDKARHAEYGAYYELYREVYGQLKGQFKKLAAL